MRTYFSLAYLILMDIILRTTPTITEETCNGLNDRYYYQAVALADSAYTFNWAISSGIYVPTKLAIGSVQFVAQYDAANEKIIAEGPCGSTSWSAFEVKDKTLRYQKDGFSFEVQCFTENGSPLKFKVLPKNNTTIEAFR